MRRKKLNRNWFEIRDSTRRSPSLFLFPLTWMIDSFLSWLSEPTVHEDGVPSIELQPPPLQHEEEKNVTIYLINLYAIKNATSNVSEEMFENEIIESAPAVLGKCETTRPRFTFITRSVYSHRFPIRL